MTRWRRQRGGDAPLIGPSPPISRKADISLLIDDDAAQSAVAAACFHTAARQQQRLFVPTTVTLELERVLRSRYRYAKPYMQRAFNALLETRELLFQCEDAIERALHAWRNGNADFADCHHVGLCMAAGRAPLLSFDARAARMAEIELPG